MKFQYSEKKVKLPGNVHAYAEKKVMKLARFFDEDAKFEWTPSGAVKTIKCSVDGNTFHVIGNFGKSSAKVNLPHGIWYDYFDACTEISGEVTLKQGEFKLLTDFF